MNTTTTTTTITRRFAIGTAIAAFCFGAAACGAESADPAGSIEKASAPQQQSRISPRAAEHKAELEAQAQRERAERADALRAAQGHTSAEHPPGSFHADTECRRVGHPKAGQLVCPATGQTQATSAPHAGGSQKYPNLQP